MTQLLLLSFVISLITLGFRAITGPGMIFYFLRSKLDKLSAYRGQLKKDIDAVHKEILLTSKEFSDAAQPGAEISPEEVNLLNKKLLELNQLEHKLIATKELRPEYGVLLYLMKPVILCTTCMASIHTLIWFPLFAGSYSWYVIPAMLIVAFMNTIFWKVVEKLGKWIRTFLISLFDKWYTISRPGTPNIGAPFR